MQLPQELKDSLCLMPWLHLYVGTDGKANACCNASITYGSVRNQTIKEIWEGEKINTFRANLLKGKKDKRCAICYNKEAAGKSSIRTETLEKFKSHFPTVLKEEQLTKPVYLDIRFSNVCNLKCRTCWHGASSSWFEDAKVLKTNFGDKAIIKATTNNSNLIEEVLEYSDDLEEVYFAGGEPLLMEEHYELLDKIIEQQSLTTLIRYNTNLTKLKLKGKSVIAYWRQLKNVHLSISIDDKEERGEVIRKGLKWSTLIENIKVIQNECPHVVIEIAPTISVYTVFTIAELHQYFYKQGLIPSLDAIYLNLLERPNYYNIQLLTIEDKTTAKLRLEHHIDWLQKNEASKKTIEEFRSLIAYLLAKNDEKSLALFEVKNKEINQLRNESLRLLTL
jgi:sulfatase maturation enzyme AslB (radical SAM superfamily)